MRKVLTTIMLLWTPAALAAVQPAEAENQALQTTVTPAVEKVQNSCAHQSEARPILLFVRTEDGHMRLVGIVKVMGPAC